MCGGKERLIAGKEGVSDALCLDAWTCWPAQPKVLTIHERRKCLGSYRGGRQGAPVHGSERDLSGRRRDHKVCQFRQQGLDTGSRICTVRWIALVPRPLMARPDQPKKRYWSVVQSQRWGEKK
jgi:hypothetical protein